MKYLSKLSRRMASMLCIPFMLAWTITGCNLPEPQALTDGLEPPPPPVTGEPGPPVAATRTCDNRPADYAVAIDVPWNVMPALQPAVSSEGFWFPAGDGSTLSLVSVSDSPLSPGSVLRIGFPRGAAAGAAPSRWGSSAFPSNTGGVYVCAWVRMSADWTNNGNVGTKFFFLKDQWNNHFVGFDSPDRGNSAFLMSGLQFRNSALANNLGQVSTASNSVSGGGWHKIEVLWQANSPGVRNGQFRQWVDGALTASSNTAMFFLAGQTPTRWSSIWFDPTYGGGTHPVPHDQWIDMDHLVVALR